MGLGSSRGRSGRALHRRCSHEACKEGLGVTAWRTNKLEDQENVLTARTQFKGDEGEHKGEQICQDQTELQALVRQLC